MYNVGLGTQLEVDFLDAIDLWDNLDKALHGIFPDFKSCVLGEGRECAGDAPVRCRACATLTY